MNSVKISFFLRKFLDYIAHMRCSEIFPGKQAALKMIQANEDLLKSTIQLTQDTLEGPCDIKLVAETLGFFCSCGK